MNMMKLAAIALLCISATTCLVAARPFDDIAWMLPNDVSDPPETVTEIDLPNYLGRWYQMYANRFVFATFERDNVCVTADYGLNLDGTVSVENNARLKYPSSPNSTVINGFAYMENPAEPGKLSVVFPSVPGSAGEYWIIKLGPLEESFPSVPLYQYAIVTDSRRLTLFVLARNPSQFRADYEKEVLAFIEAEGFTTYLNAPKATVQEPDCIYAGEAPKSQKTEAMASGNIEQAELKRILFRSD